MSPRPQYLVAGPPCGGKTSWVHGRLHPGETVLDFDDIVEWLGGQRYTIDFSIVQQAQSMWKDRLLESDYVIWTAPRRTDRGRFRSQYGAGVIVVMASEAICLARAEAERPPHWQGLIHDWFDLWEPSRSGHELIIRTDDDVPAALGRPHV